jgi:hypothetical protein
MKKLTIRAKWLYKTKQFDKFHDLLMRTKEGRDFFNELCKADTVLRAWYTAFLEGIWDKAIDDPKKEAAARETFYSHGIGHMFDLYKVQRKKGFVTVNEVAKAIGVDAEDVQEALRIEPVLFNIYGINIIK